MSIEKTILSRDRRGISELRKYVADDYCDRAAKLILENPGTAVIATGFYILDSGAVETDGPPGAIAIGNALEALGYKVVYLTDHYGLSVMERIKSQNSEILEFPITDEEESQECAKTILKDVNPSVLIAIERCGFTADKKYRNMRGRDITAYTAKIDYLFQWGLPSVGVGDGGNEIGMGNLSKEIMTVPSLVDEPCTTSVSELVLASVSNWGGYGLASSLSNFSNKNLLPRIEEEEQNIISIVEAGAVDGMSGLTEHKVDGFTLEENTELLKDLHQLVVT